MVRRGHGKGTPGSTPPPGAPPPAAPQRADAARRRKARWMRRPLAARMPARAAAPEHAVVGPVKARGRPAGDPGNRTPTTKRNQGPLASRTWTWLMEEPKTEKEAAKAPAAPTRPASRKATRPRGAAPIVSRLVAKWRGPGKESKRTQETKEAVPGPPAPDLRGLLVSFLRSKRRGVAFARSGLIIALILLSTWTVVLATTGFNLVDAVTAPVDEDDISTLLRTPFFVVESGSLMQRNQPFGRMHTIDPGDIVIVERIQSREDVETFYGTGDRFVANGRGDVIVFLPVPTQTNPYPSAIVHRAVAYLERSIVSVPNPDAGPGRPVTVQSPRFTVAEFGIYDARAVTIPELGLHNYQPDRGGFITRGDNPRTNNWADQALGVTAFPVPEDRVLGRVKYMVPYLGLAKLALVGQDPNMISPDSAWCSFLAGKAPCDNWLVFLVIVAVFVGTPFCITLYIFVRRALERRRERQEIQRQQETSLERQREQEAKDAERERAEEAARRLVLHDAVDLLSGRVVPPGTEAIAASAGRAPHRYPRGGLSLDGDA